MAENSSFNGVILFCRGDDDEAPVIGSAWDNNPNSHTYYKGEMGQIPYILINEEIPRPGQALEHAEHEANVLAAQMLVQILSERD